MMKKVLPMKDPIVSSYTSYGILFSLITEECMPWVYNNLIQISYARAWEILIFNQHRLFLKNCPNLTFYSMSKIMLEKGFKSNIKEAIINAIDLNQYVMFYIDRYYIPAAEEYQKHHLYHEIFIYGYDLEQDSVYIADNFMDGKFVKTECEFNQLIEGYENLDSEYCFMSEVNFIEVNKSFQCTIKLDQIQSGLEDYLYSRKSYDMNDEQKFYFGMDTLSKVQEYLLYTKEKGLLLDIRPFHVLYEQKLLMKMRVMYLTEHHYIEMPKQDIEAFIYVEHCFKGIRNEAIKYNLRTKASYLDKMLERLNEAVLIEKDIIKNLISALAEKID